MNQNRRVLRLVLLFTALLFVFSLLQVLLNLHWPAFQRVNLLADVVTSTALKKKNIAANNSQTNAAITNKNGRRKNFSLYQKPKLITDFSADTSQASLTVFVQKLFALKNGKKKKIRIAYFGDSMIEGDLITGTFRKMMQQQFGGSGVGFVPITSQVAGYRVTVSHTFSDWKEQNFKTITRSNNHLYLSGHIFYSNDGWVSITDNTITDPTAVIEKCLLCGKGQTNVSVENKDVAIHANALVNRIVLERSQNHSVTVSVADSSLPVYGISFESDSGLIVDNFSFRGISGHELATIDTDLLKSVAACNDYDLIIMQYGVNLMFRANDTSYNWYPKAMTPAIVHFKNSFPQSNLLLISAGDRAFRYGDEYKTAIGMDSLIQMQAQMAYDNDCSFYNLYQTMGGNGSIVDWANADPPLASKDYIHPNFRGADVLGNDLYEAMMSDYNKYTASAKPSQ